MQETRPWTLAGSFSSECGSLPVEHRIVNGTCRNTSLLLGAYNRAA